MGDVWYFLGKINSGIANSLWSLGPNDSGALELKKVFPSLSLSVGQPIALGDVIYFQGSDEEHGSELWVTDGTESGTHLIRDINEGPTSSQARFLNIVNNTLVFEAFGNTGVRIYKSDGTVDGTKPLLDGGEGKNLGPAGIYYLRMGGLLYFLGIERTNDPPEMGLWRTDGTPEGTRAVKTDTLDWSMSAQGGVSGDDLFFLFHDKKHGSEIWRSDGTTGGTEMVENIFPGGVSSAIEYITELNGGVYFLAKDPTHGTEIWKVDDEHCGAVRVTDNTDIKLLAIVGTVGNKLLVTGESEMFGRETFAYDVSQDREGKSAQRLTVSIPSQMSRSELITDLVTSSAGLPLSYWSSNESVAVVEGNAIKFIGEGSVIIEASQAGNDEYCHAGTTVTLNSIILGLEDPLGRVEVYPNPTETFLYMANLNLDNVRISVIDHSGRLVMEGTSTSRIDVSTLPSGLYLVTINSGNEERTFRVIKK
jgi:ELWxxDGT repeat protein